MTQASIGLKSWDNCTRDCAKPTKMKKYVSKIDVAVYKEKIIHHNIIMNRRFLIITILAVLSPFRWSPKKSVKVIFSVNFKRMGLSAQEFYSLRSKYENDAAINKMNSLFEKNGLILDRTFNHHSNGLKWTYTFKDIATFNGWEKNLYDLGMVKKENRPYIVDREYILLA